MSQLRHALSASICFRFLSNASSEVLPSKPCREPSRATTLILFQHCLDVLLKVLGLSGGSIALYDGTIF